MLEIDSQDGGVGKLWRLAAEFDDDETLSFLVEQKEGEGSPVAALLRRLAGEIDGTSVQILPVREPSAKSYVVAETGVEVTGGSYTNTSDETQHIKVNVSGDEGLIDKDRRGKAGGLAAELDDESPGARFTLRDLLLRAALTYAEAYEACDDGAWKEGVGDMTDREAKATALEDAALRYVRHESDASARLIRHHRSRPGVVADVRIHRAQALGDALPSPTLISIIDDVPQERDEAGRRVFNVDMFVEEAEALADALSAALPGGTLQRLLSSLMRREADRCELVVPVRPTEKR